MATEKLTKRVIDAAAPEAGRYIIWDSELRGFGLRVEASGTKTFLVRYRAGGGGRKAPRRFIAIGRYGTLTAEEARRLAKVRLAEVTGGKDPAGERAKARKALTFTQLVEVFLSDHVAPKRKPATHDSYKDSLARLVEPEIGTTRADQVTRQDVAKLHLKLRKKPFQANRVLAIIGSLYAFAGRRGYVPEGYNPARHIERYREQGRERYLSQGELERIGAALRLAETEGLPWAVDDTKPNAKHTPKKRHTVMCPFAVAGIRLLILTGARLREILNLKWDYVDFERGLLLLPDSKTGKKVIVLNAPALAVLADLPKVGDYVIAGQGPYKPRKTPPKSKPALVQDPDKKTEGSPRSDLKRPWDAIARHAGLSGVRLHDLRHTFASYGATSGLGLPVIGKLLGHTQSVTTARYAHLDNDPLRKASNTIGGTLAAAMGDAKPGKGEVVSINTGKR